MDILDVADHAGIAQLFAAHFQHRVVDVRQHYPTALAHQAGEFSGQVARAASEIQHALPATHAATVNRKALPQTMNAKRHQVVHDVVFRGHRMKHLRDFIGFFRFRYSLEAKVRCFL
nr:hypothetical protein [Franconibacter helveticus]